MKIELSNVVLRAYKKKDCRIALHLRGHLLVHTNVGFSLTGYLKEMQSWITLPGQTECRAHFMSVAVGCTYSEEIMIHDFRVQFMLPNQKLERTTANLKVMFHISITGDSREEPTYIERKAIIVPYFRWPPPSSRGRAR